MSGSDLGHGAPHPPEFINRVIVQSASQLVSIDPTKEYFIDGVIDLAGATITVPAAGLSLRGHNFNISKIIDSTASATIFDGSGQLDIIDMALSASGVGSKVFDLSDPTGLNSIELTRINFDDCSSLGEINKYRQGLETGCGRFGGSPELTLSGNWIGGYRATTSLARALSAGFTGSLYKAGVGFVMNSRFLSDMNIDLPAGASFIDFAPANFANPETLQLLDCIVSRNGAFDSQDANITPNINPSNTACIWRNNKGMSNTFIGGRVVVSAEAETTIVTDGVYVAVAGAWAASDLQHFSNPSNERLTNLGEGVIEFSVDIQIAVRGVGSEVCSVRIMKHNFIAATNEVVDEQSRLVHNLSGPTNIALIDSTENLTLLNGDYLFLEVANIGSTGNFTIEDDSSMIITER